MILSDVAAITVGSLSGSYSANEVKKTDIKRIISIVATALISNIAYHFARLNGFAQKVENLSTFPKIAALGLGSFIVSHVSWRIINALYEKYKSRGVPSS